MSFLIDGPWLYGTGRLIAQLPPERQAVASTATAAAFLITSVSLYLERGWTRPIWRLCRARSGRDWMVNSGVLRIDERRIGRRGHIIAALLFTGYPFWLRFGLERGRRR